MSFTIGYGEVVALVGESGSGKSTTARLLARLMLPTEGEIFFKGKDIVKEEPRGASLGYRSDVQMIFQDPFGSLNAVHTIGFHLERPLLIHKKVRGAQALRDRVLELLTTVGPKSRQRLCPKVSASAFRRAASARRYRPRACR